MLAQEFRRLFLAWAGEEGVLVQVVLSYNFSEASFLRNSRETAELFHTESSEKDSLLLSFM